MVPVRHRRRLTFIRALAVVTPALAATCAVVAFTAGGAWPIISATVGGIASVVLGAVVFRLERKLKVEVAAVRAEQAAEYAQTHARYADEHREFTNHMVGLLDAASERLDSLRERLDNLEVEASQQRARPSASTPSDQLARRTERGDWNDLWPDLSDAPTVVDLVAWEDQHRELVSEHTDNPSAALDDEPEERTA